MPARRGTGVGSSGPARRLPREPGPGTPAETAGRLLSTRLRRSATAAGRQDKGNLRELRAGPGRIVSPGHRGSPPPRAVPPRPVPARCSSSSSTAARGREPNTASPAARAALPPWPGFQIPAAPFFRVNFPSSGGLETQFKAVNKVKCFLFSS